MRHMFYSGWESLLRTVVVGVLAYIALVFILRITGKRTLSKLNAFDLVITVSLGSTLATVLLNKNVALAEGILAFVVLCTLQFIVTWSSVRSQWIRGIAKSEPRLLLHRGVPLVDAMKRERVTYDEIQAAIRLANLHDVQEADAVILETDGTLSVISQSEKYGADQLCGMGTSHS